MAFWAAVRRLMLGFPSEWLLPEARDFVRAAPDRERALQIPGNAFRTGYHLALERPDAGDLVPALRAIDAMEQGFSFEGAAMAMAILDWLAPWRRGWRDLVEADEGRHLYVCLVGAGWAAARLQLPFARAIRAPGGSLRWLTGDGIGFHEGYFHFGRYAQGRGRYRKLDGYARRSFDQGFGRSLWFSFAASPPAIARAIGSREPERHDDLWSGIGLAAAYAGGIPEDDLQKLRELATSHRGALAQGAAFGAEARERAGIGVAHTALACRMLIGCEVDEAVSVVRARRPEDDDASELAYERWRSGVQVDLLR
jgi:hypothetical protein